MGLGFNEVVIQNLILPRGILHATINRRGNQEIDMFKNYSLIHAGRGEPDHLVTESVSQELFDKYRDEDYQIKVGGGWNGIYLLIPAELKNADTGEFEGCDINHSIVPSHNPL